MNKQAVNTFKQGLVMDLNPLANDNKSLTNALNATFITQNGNELMLQNDMGNGRINRVRLDDGYIPVGIKEYGGIIYIASYNPKNGKCQIGSFPYPKLEWENQDFENREYVLNSIYGNDYIKANSTDTQGCVLDFYEILDDSIKIPLLIDSTGTQLKIRTGDSFSVTFSDETLSFLNSPNIELKLLVKTSSNYYEVSNNKSDILSSKKFVYGGFQSGYVYLQINLIIYNNFEVDYTMNTDTTTIYPRAYSDTHRELGISCKAVVLKDEEIKTDNTRNITNIQCDLSNYDNNIIVESNGIYHIYPVTQDGGYILNLHRKLILDSNIPCSNGTSGSTLRQFKYTFNNDVLKVLYEYQNLEDQYSESGDVTFYYRFYPIKSISESIDNINNLDNLYNNSTYTTEVIKSGYNTKSGVRYFETELPNNDIYLLVVSYNKSMTNEKVIFTRFIYATERFNTYYDQYDDYNLINKEDVFINYSLDSNILQAELYKIDNYNLIGEQWENTKDLINYSETIIPEENIPKAFKSKVTILVKKTQDLYTECYPDNNYNYILDKEIFNIPTNSIKLNIQNAVDQPQKSSSNVLLTDNQDNTIPEPIIDSYNGTLLFYRYISSLDNDGIVQQDRIIKNVYPVFDPNQNFEELLGFNEFNNSMDTVVCAKKFLSDSCSRLLNVYYKNYYFNPGQGWVSFLAGEESLSSGSVKLSNLQSALLNHSANLRGTNTPSIFDIFAGGNSNDEEDEDPDFEDAAKWGSLAINGSNNVYINSTKMYGDIPNSGINIHDDDELDSDDNWMIATCLNVKGKPMPINLASHCFSKIFDSGTFVGDYVTSNGAINSVRSNGSDYPKLMDIKKCSYINVAKKLQCFLSQIFTLQNIQKNIYLVGPSIGSLNYNIQDNSYMEYSCSIYDGNSQFSFSKDIDIALDQISYNLNKNSSCDNNIHAKNYIGSVKGDTVQNTYNYGHLVNFGSQLFSNLLSTYENCYDNEEILDQSNGFTDEDIYYLDAEQIKNNYISDFSEDFIYEDQDIISENQKIWNSKGIYFNPKYHCFTYDLGVLDPNLIKKSEVNKTTCLFDWTGYLWYMESLRNNFTTVFKAQREYSNVISNINNNYILLTKTTPDIKTKWVENSNTAGPGIVFINFGVRGLCRRLFTSAPLLRFNVNFEKRLLDIINKYEYSRLKKNGYLST